MKGSWSQNMKLTCQGARGIHEEVVVKICMISAVRVSCRLVNIMCNQTQEINKSDDVPREVPTKIAVGVARPRAHGHETTWNSKSMPWAASIGQRIIKEIPQLTVHSALLTNTSTDSFKLKSKGFPFGPAISLSKTSGKIWDPM